MAERKLNFSAPLMSVRRIASRPMSPARDNKKIVKNSSPNRRQTATIRGPPSEPNFTLEQVTEPVAVPFNWEQIPGQRKDGNEPEPLRQEVVTSITPRVPPGKLCDVTKQPLETDYANRTDSRPQIKTQYSFSSNVVDSSSKYSKEATNERAALELDEAEEDVYSDALDTLSSKESVSLNCSASGLSGSDGVGLVKPSGSFSTDPHTRDFMMKRFLPAAKAMALESPRAYSPKRQALVVQEQPREVKKVIGEEKRPSTDLIVSNLVQRYGDYQQVEGEEEEESEEEEVDHQYDDPRNISMRGCGFFPRLCFKNSLSLLGPVPGLKIKTGTPRKTAYNQSHSKSVKMAWDSTFKQKSDGGSRSAQLQVVENKRAGESKRFTYSGDLQRGRLSPFRSSRAADTASNDKQKTDFGFRSAELKVIGDSRRLTYSGDLRSGRLSPFRQSRVVEMDFNDKRKTHDGVRSGELKVVENRLIGESRRLTYSGDLQRGGSSPFRNPRAASISPYRNQSSQSPFRRGAFLGIPKDDESVKAAKNMLSVYNKGSNKFQDTSTNHRNNAIEKTLYVDTVNNAETLYTNSSSFDKKAQMNSAGEDFAHLLVLAKEMKAASGESVFQDIRCLNNVEKEGTDKRSSLLVESELGLDQKVKSLDCLILAAKGNQDKGCDLIQKEDSGDVNSSLVPSALPPPLPKSPSESWLWRTIPSIPFRNSFSSTSFGSKRQGKTPESKTSSTTTKWETIVKTSNLHHDHSRYSEELVAHISKQSKT